MVLYRLFQEALNNALKHARATEVHVRLERGPVAPGGARQRPRHGYHQACRRHGPAQPGPARETHRITARLTSAPAPAPPSPSNPQSSTAPIPVALVDDHTLRAKGLVETDPAVGRVRSGVGGLNRREFIEALPHPDLRLAIVDLNMPEMDGFETLAWLKENQPGLLALALTFEGTEERVIRAVRAGPAASS